MLIISVIIILIVLIISVYFYNNLNYDKRLLKKIFKSGFKEKQVILADGTVLNYGEGPKNGEALFLIHGQGVEWKNYAKVLPELSKNFHIYAVDCHGHGKSSKNPKKYTAEKMGKDFIWFIENVIGKATLVSGHSSGGLLTVWLAANSPNNVKGIVLEDPPLFSTEKNRYEKTYAWVDGFRLIHAFHQQNEENDYVLYYLKHSYWKGKFGKLWNSIIKQARLYRKKYPNKKLRIFYLPPSINKIWESISSKDYDINFGYTFYDCSWFENFEQAESLSSIQCPSVLIFAKNTRWEQYDDNGILLGAMSDEDALRAHKLLAKNKLVTIDCGHGVHDEKPQAFIEIIKGMLS